MLLAKHLGSLVLIPVERGYEITGTFVLHLPVDGEVDPSVCDRSSSGGVLLGYSETAWMPMEFMTSGRSTG